MGEKYVDVPVQKTVEVPQVQKVQKYQEVITIETLERVVDVPVIKQVEVPQIQTVEKIVEIPSIQTVEKVIEIPQLETVAGETRMVNVAGPTERRNAPPEVVQVTEIGPDLPAEV